MAINILMLKLNFNHASVFKMLNFIKFDPDTRHVVILAVAVLIPNGDNQTDIVRKVHIIVDLKPLKRSLAKW